MRLQLPAHVLLFESDLSSQTIGEVDLCLRLCIWVTGLCLLHVVALLAALPRGLRPQKCDMPCLTKSFVLTGDVCTPQPTARVPSTAAMSGIVWLCCREKYALVIVFVLIASMLS